MVTRGEVAQYNDLLWEATGNTMLHCEGRLSFQLDEWAINRHVNNCTDTGPHSGFTKSLIKLDPLSGSAKKDIATQVNT